MKSAPICYIDHGTGESDHMNAHIQTSKCLGSATRCRDLMVSSSTGGALRECGAVVENGRCFNGHRQSSSLRAGPGVREPHEEDGWAAACRAKDAELDTLRGHRKVLKARIADLEAQLRAQDEALTALKAT